MSDIYGVVVGGIAALKGPLLEGAHEAVVHLFRQIGDPNKVADWLNKAFSEK